MADVASVESFMAVTYCKIEFEIRESNQGTRKTATGSASHNIERKEKVNVVS
jgi:hypothetical protein